MGSAPLRLVLFRSVLRACGEVLDIYDIIRDAIDSHKLIDNPGVDEIIEIEKNVYEYLDKNYK